MAGESSVQAIGASLAYVYIAYGLGLVVLAAWGGQMVALAVLGLVVVRKKKARILRLTFEVIYGLLNPLVYLVVLRPGFVTYEAGLWQRLPLQSVAWSVLVLLWTMRIAGAALANTLPIESVRRSLVWAALACVLLFGVKDAALYPLLAGPPSLTSLWNTAWTLSMVVPLYLIPALLLVDHLRGDNGQAPTATRFFLLPAGPALAFGLMFAAIGLASVAVSVWRPSDDAARRVVLAHRDVIRKASAEFDVDPAVVASIVYVTQRNQITPFRDQVERLVMAAWLVDLKSNFQLGRALNISIGLAQIKPATAQTAAMLAAHDGKSEVYDKEYREVPRLVLSLPHDLASRLPIPWQRPAGKERVVETLLDDRGNLRTCALILAVYQLQWQTDAHGSPIRDRPDILGTLFQIGFERSHPKASPQSNAFGRQVQQVHDSPWLQEAFR
jgi:hypothetical protein